MVVDSEPLCESRMIEIVRRERGQLVDWDDRTILALQRVTMNNMNAYAASTAPVPGERPVRLGDAHPGRVRVDGRFLVALRRRA